VDSYSLLEKINNCAEKTGKIMPVLLELNTSEESTKSGFESEGELIDCLKRSFSLKNIVVKGFMTVGPVDHRKASISFARLRELSIQCIKLFPEHQFPELSMGMSQDYQIAIKEGSTLVRIGTKIFGERKYV